MRESIEWRSALTSLPRRGQRVLARTHGFTGEAYLSTGNVWYRPGGVSWDTTFEHSVLEWAEMPYALPEV